MLLNSTPNTDGLIPEDDMAIYKALGEEIKRRFDNPIASTSGKGRNLSINLGKPTQLNHVILMEDYTQGERIRKYEVEGWDGKRWKVITGGKHVGRKHINYFDDVTVSKLRLKILESIDQPIIKLFAAQYVANFKKPASVNHVPYHASPAEIAAIKKATQSNWRKCDTWTKEDLIDGTVKLKIDLTGKITEAGQWQVSGRSCLHLPIPKQNLRSTMPFYISRIRHPYRAFLNRIRVIPGYGISIVPQW